VDAAIEQFNGGQLGRAVQMFDLARRMALAEKIEPGYVAPIRSTTPSSSTSSSATLGG